MIPFPLVRMLSLLAYLERQFMGQFCLALIFCSFWGPHVIAFPPWKPSEQSDPGYHLPTVEGPVSSSYQSKKQSWSPCHWEPKQQSWKALVNTCGFRGWLHKGLPLNKLIRSGSGYPRWKLRAITMTVDTSKSKEPPHCQDRVLKDRSELSMQGKEQDLLYT